MTGSSQNPAPLAIAAVVATRGRAEEILRRLESLRRQTCPGDEILIIDRHEDDRLVPLLPDYSDLPIRHFRTPHLRGLNRNRNFGWQQASSGIVIFPDDDCWYPGGFFEKAQALFRETGADVVCSRPTDLTGRTINGEFLSNPCWGAGEMQDLSLKVLSEGVREYCDPSLTAPHPEVLVSRANGNRYLRVPAYVCGMGYVLAGHGFSLPVALRWSLRPVAAALIAAARLDFWTAGLKLSSGWNRLKGYLIRRNEMRSEARV